MTSGLRFVIDWIRRYAANPDPKSAAANSIALIIGGNQPFYPVYVYALVGDHALPSLLTLLSSPLFLAVPAMGRRSRIGGSILLCIAGLANTSLSAWMMGAASGIDMFFLPCLVISIMLFGRGERGISAGFVGATTVLYLIFDQVIGAGALFSLHDAQALRGMNRASGLVLSAFIVFLLTRPARRSVT